MYSHTTLNPIALLKRHPNAIQNLRQLARDQLSLNPEHAIPGSSQLLIPTRVGPLALRVIASINLDDQPLSGRKEINDETQHRDLATKFDTELSRAERGPERSF
jgi:hypothetical protein